MDNVLVLGLIPGTNIAISFQMWIAAGALIVAVRPTHHLYRRVQSAMIKAGMHQPLHASQLHRRLPQMAR